MEATVLLGYVEFFVLLRRRHCSSVVEHFLGKEEVAGSIPANGSVCLKRFSFGTKNT